MSNANKWYGHGKRCRDWRQTAQTIVSSLVRNDNNQNQVTEPHNASQTNVDEPTTPQTDRAKRPRVDDGLELNVVLDQNQMNANIGHYSSDEHDSEFEREVQVVNQIGNRYSDQYCDFGQTNYLLRKDRGRN